MNTGLSMYLWIYSAIGTLSKPRLFEYTIMPLALSAIPGVPIPIHSMQSIERFAFFTASIAVFAISSAISEAGRGQFVFVDAFEMIS